MANGGHFAHAHAPQTRILKRASKAPRETYHCTHRAANCHRAPCAHAPRSTPAIVRKNGAYLHHEHDWKDVTAINRRA